MWSFMSVRLLGKYKQPLVNLSGLIKRRQKIQMTFIGYMDTYSPRK